MQKKLTWLKNMNQPDFCCPSVVLELTVFTVYNDKLERFFFFNLSTTVKSIYRNNIDSHKEVQILQNFNFPINLKPVD